MTLNKLKIWGHFKTIIFAYLDFQHFVSFGKDGHRKVPKIRVIKSPKIMDMRLISIKKHGGFVANMVQISITKHKMIFSKFYFL